MKETEIALLLILGCGIIAFALGNYNAYRETTLYNNDADVWIDVGLIENFTRCYWHWNFTDTETGEILAESSGSHGVG